MATPINALHDAAREPSGYEVRAGELLFSDRPERLDLAMIHDFLARRSYWSTGIPREVLERALRNSLCMGAYRDGGARQVGFGRVITDRATFGWVADVFVLEGERGTGVGKGLVAALLGHPDLRGVRSLRLATVDAQGLYARHGFTPLAHPEHFMEFRRPNPYNSDAPAVERGQPSSPA